MAANPDQRVLLAGFANEVGTDEFNRVLGEARAQTVRQKLLQQGIAAERIHTVSYGNEFGERDGAEGRRVEVGIVQ
jgi:outer membrane protein OmpA-like peptidoglycan-associated protein